MNVISHLICIRFYCKRRRCKVCLFSVYLLISTKSILSIFFSGFHVTLCVNVHGTNVHNFYFTCDSSRFISIYDENNLLEKYPGRAPAPRWIEMTHGLKRTALTIVVFREQTKKESSRSHDDVHVAPKLFPASSSPPSPAS